MLYKRFTRHGISKLTRLQGKFCKCDVVVQVFLEDYPMGGDEPEPIREYNAIVSDATNCFPAIFNDSGLEIYRGLMTVVCVTEALCCISPSGQNILIINAFQPVQISPEFAFSLPHRVCVPDLDVTRENPLPIAALPYFPEIELIPRMRVLVTYKSVLDDPRCCRTDPMFVVHLLDESDEVRAYATKQVALELYDKLESGKVYYITNLGRHFKRNEYFFNLPNLHSLELMKYTIIEECDDLDIPKLRFDFSPLSTPKYWLNDGTARDNEVTYIDVIGILQTVGTLDTAPHKKELPIKKVTIIDQSEQTLSVTLWSYNAEGFRASPGTIVAFRHARLPYGHSELPSTPRGETPHLLSVVTTSTVHIEPDVEERFALRQWYDSRSPPVLNPQIKEGTLCEPYS